MASLAGMVLLVAATASTPATPPQMQGVWARRGHCASLADRLTVSAHSARWGRASWSRTIYDADQGAIEWAEDGVVDNFVLAPKGDVLVHNIEGFGMPEREGLARCGSDASPGDGVPHRP